MARTFVVKTRYTADGKQVQQVHTKMGRSFGRFANQMADGNSMLSRSFGGLNKTINRAAMIGMTALVAGAGLAAREFVKFDQTIVGANTRFVDFVQGSQQSAETLQALKDAAREVGATTQFSATDAAAGLNFYAKAGFTSAEAMAVLEDTVNLATVAEMDFNRTADISSDLLGAMGLNAENSAEKIENLKTLNRALGIATNAANVSLEDLFETLKVAGPVGTAAGENMNELVAMTAALGGAGIKGSMGATALKNAYTRLAAPTDKVLAALSGIGLSQSDFIDQNGDMKSMVAIMGMLGRATDGLGKAEQLGIFSEVFGKNAVAGATNLSKSLSEVEFIMAKLEGDTALKDLADEIRKGLGMQLQILRSGLIELGFQFVEAFETDGRGALQGLIDFVQNFDIAPLIKFAEVTVDVFTFLASHWRLLLSLTAGIKAVSATLVVLNILTNIFGVTLAATPIGMIIAGIAALAVAITWLVLNWDKVVEVTKKVGAAIADLAVRVFTFAIEKLKQFGGWIMDNKQKLTALLGPIGMLVSGIMEIVGQWDNVKKAFSEQGIGAGLLSIGRALIGGILAPLQGILEVASLIPGIGKFAENGAMKLQELRDQLAGEEISAIGGAQTPTPGFTGAQAAELGTGRVDININNNAGENADIRQTGTMPTGTNLNFQPAVSF